MAVVNRETICEQLIYEIGDPAHYLTPDVDVDFTGVEVSEVAPNVVRLGSTRGRAAPAEYKVSLAYRAGFATSSQLLVYGRDCVAKAERCRDHLCQIGRPAGIELERTHVECLGATEGVPGVAASPSGLREVMLRISVHDSRREAVERFTKELAPLITAGPAGLAGYASGRSSVRPVFAYWPTLVPRELVPATVSVKSASDWGVI